MLKQGAWYKIRTLINNREALFCRSDALAMFDAVLNETKIKFVFEIRGLLLGEDRLEFYIKPVEGLELPAIMKWLKQTFAQRYNTEEGRTGHIWGDRYWSGILEGEAPLDKEDGNDVPNAGGLDARVRPCSEGSVVPDAVGLDAGVRPRGEDAVVSDAEGLDARVRPRGEDAVVPDAEGLDAGVRPRGEDAVVPDAEGLDTGVRPQYSESAPQFAFPVILLLFTITAPE
jgi:REP element-mobilizing transposase RayT